MSQEKMHTPGPWGVMWQNSRARRYDPRLPKFWEVPVQVGEGASGGNVICTVSMGGPGATQSTKESVEANARLIAAAPDLYEAGLKLMESINQMDPEQRGCSTVAYAEMWEALSKARPSDPARSEEGEGR